MASQIQPNTLLPKRASYTQLSTAARCSFRYWLRYMAGVEPTTKGAGLIRGTLLHEAYDRYMYTGREDHQVAYDTAEAAAQRELDNGADAGQVNEVLEEARVVLDAYLPWADKNDNWEVIIYNNEQQCETSGEYELTLPDGSKWPFVFKIDAHITLDGAHLMLENKFRKNLDANGLEHDLQILLYQAAWNALHPKQRIEGVLYNIVGAKPRKKDGAIAVREFYYRGKQEEAIGLRMAGAMVQNLRYQSEHGLWPMNPRKECNWDCDYVGLCLGVRAGSSVSEYVESGAYQLADHREREGDGEDE